MNLFSNKILGVSPKYTDAFIDNVNRACALEYHLKKIEDLSQTFLKEYVTKESRWDKAATSFKNYSEMMFTPTAKGPFVQAGIRFKEIGTRQKDMGTTIMTNFHTKLHAFNQTEGRELMDVIKHLERLRKDADKAEKRAAKGKEQLATTQAAEANAAHDKYLATAEVIVTRYLSGTDFFVDSCKQWIETEKNMDNFIRDNLDACANAK